MKLTEAQAKAILGKHYKPNREKTKKTPGGKTQKQPSLGEAELMLQLRANKIAYKPEFKFAEHRRWRADFLITGTRILIEVEGGIFSNGRHTRGTGYTKDCEKYNWAASNNWLLLRFTTAQVQSGAALDAIVKTLENQGSKYDY